MAKNLIIVESPTKVTTIKKFLGSNYQVIATMGHIRDLPKSTLGIDIENDYEPKYITIRGKGPKLTEIKKEVKKANKIFLATDPDREGEAISWHILQAIDTSGEIKRITFNEITKDAVKNAIKHPRNINMDLVDAQQARRALDRMVGYSISPLLWKKVKRGLSAGRVQSVALKLIAERDKEIEEFIRKEYYTIDAVLKIGTKVIETNLVGKNGKKIELNSGNLSDIVSELKNENFNIESIKHSNRQRRAPLPFTTSTLQQEAAKRLGFAVSKTMKIAQELYEGIKITGHGTVGLITYLRTDSTRISDTARKSAVEFISKKYGKNFVGNESAVKNATNAQDAHEAIRPSYIDLIPDNIINSLSKDQYRLYDLIWSRFIASQMKRAEFETTVLNIKSNSGYDFKASTNRCLFKGFLEVYSDESAGKTDKNILSISEKDKITLVNIYDEKHYTEPPAHFNEASLIKTLENLGIGRPSTYAPTVATLKLRRYITVEKKNLFVTELGKVVNFIMKDCFKEIVDVEFTAKMEKALDDVADGDLEWKQILRKFYPHLSELVDNAESKLEKVTIADEVTDEICEKCGRNMVIKYGPHGKFLACPGFPECSNTRPYYEKIGVACPKCGKDVVVKFTAKNRRYYGCIDNPNCDFMSWNEPTGDSCPKCGSFLEKRGKKVVCSNKECNYGKE